ncbi:hypothetical protein RKK42_06055 [Klebsiella pneumoniae]|nr:hypothetical protein [Klebsiella pneumoniae]
MRKASGCSTGRQRLSSCASRLHCAAQWLPEEAWPAVHASLMALLLARSLDMAAAARAGPS